MELSLQSLLSKQCDRLPSRDMQGQTSVAQNVSRPRAFNLASYTGTTYNNANNSVKMNSYKTGMGRPVYNNKNSNNGFSNTLKQIFNSGTNININSSNSSGSSPSRSYTPSSNSSSSSSSSSGSSGSSVAEVAQLGRAEVAIKS
jgi:hypothetical protein